LQIDLIRKIFKRFNIWRRRRLKERQYVIILSIVVGFSSGLAAVALKNAVFFIQSLLKAGSLKGEESYLYLIYPGLGILLTVLVSRFFFKGKLGQSIPNVLQSISKSNSIMPRSATYRSLITSLITVGFGGSVGLEGPTVGASSAIGSNYSRWSRLNYQKTTLMLGCGAAAAMSGIFHAPIAAVVFALEVIMLDLTVSSMIPLLMASISATLTSYLMFGDEVLFDIEVIDSFLLSDVPFYILLGILTGLLSVYFCKSYWSIERAFDKVRGRYQKVLVGSLILGGLIFLFPPLYGEGFVSIKAMLNGNIHELFEGSIFFDYRNDFWVLALFLLAIVFIKSIATTLTLGAGGFGGVFAPSMFMGSAFGFLFARAMNQWGLFSLSERNFTLVSMAGLIAGILQAPLTGLFLIAEITSGYELIIPLMITAAISFLTARYFQPHSLYTLQLAEKGELITHNKDQAVLTLMQLKTEVENDFSTIQPDQTLGELVKVVSRSSRNLFPVVNEDGSLEGIVLLDDIRQVMFKPKKYDKIQVWELMIQHPDAIASTDSMEVVMEKFQQTGAWNLPVIDEGKYVGFVSKSKLFNDYRKILKDFHE